MTVDEFIERYRKGAEPTARQRVWISLLLIVDENVKTSGRQSGRSKFMGWLRLYALDDANG